jgi:hypothetical protein
MTNKTELQNYTLLTIDSSFDSQIASWIEQVTKYIESQTNKSFTVDAEPVERLYDGNGRDTLLIDDFTAFDEVFIDGQDVTDEIIAYPANTTPKYKIVYPSGFPRGNQNVAVTATFGQEAPDDLKWASTVLVAGIMQNAQKLDGDITSERIGNYTVHYKSDQQRSDFDRAMEIIASYKNYAI